MRNFGHDGPEKFNGAGINGKNSEFHAAMGLCNLNYIEAILNRRKEQHLYYDYCLRGMRVDRQAIQEGCEHNYSYYPIVFETEDQTLKARDALVHKEIFPRRYFYPSLSSLDYVCKTPTPVSDSIASRILCLPLYYELSNQEQNMIARILLRSQNY
jgi:dTDP-4-amino-4,6-dideoxygalactose transaminase